jgi:hypothetical protein
MFPADGRGGPVKEPSRHVPGAVSLIGSAELLRTPRGFAFLPSFGWRPARPPAPEHASGWRVVRGSAVRRLSLPYWIQDVRQVSILRDPNTSKGNIKTWCDSRLYAGVPVSNAI